MRLPVFAWLGIELLGAFILIYGVWRAGYGDAALIGLLLLLFGPIALALAQSISEHYTL